MYFYIIFIFNVNKCELNFNKCELNFNKYNNYLLTLYQN